MEGQNYYLLLELETDPPEHDYSVIQNAIRKKRSLWVRRLSNADSRLKAEKYLELLKDAEEKLNDHTNRVKEAQEAVNLKKAEVRKKELEAFEKLNKYIGVLSQKGFIYEHEIDLMEKDFDLTKDQIRSQITAVPIHKTSFEMEETNETKAALSKERMGQINTLLRTLITDKPQKGNVPTLYDLVKMSEGSSHVELHKKAESNHNSLFDKGATSENVLKRNAFSQAMTVFKDEDTRLMYDEALSIQRFQPVTELINIAGFTGELDEQVYQELVKQGVNEGLTQSDTEERIHCYCKQKTITIGKKAETKPSTIELQQCGVCGHVNDSKGSSCTRCGNHLTRGCKKCNAESSSAVNYCSECGIAFADLQIQEHYLKRAEWALLKNDFQLAKENVELAKYYWEDNEDLKIIYRRISYAENQLKDHIDSVEKLVLKKHFYTAEKELGKFKLQYRNQSELGILERTIRNRINMSEEYIHKAGTLSNSEEIVEYLQKAVKECVDCELAIQKLNQFPPIPPEDFQVKESNQCFHLEWESTYQEDNIFYIIECQDGTSPKRKIAETKNSFFIDRRTEGGKRYFYTIQIGRGKKVSENGVTKGPFMRLGEVENPRVFSNTDKIILKWKAPTHAKVEVWKKEGSIPKEQGDGTKLLLSDPHELVDKDVTDGKVYGYFVVAEYEDEHGRPLYSKGLGLKAILAAPPDTTFSIEEEEEAIFIKWEELETGSLQLFYSEYPLNGIEINEFVPYSRLLRDFGGRLIETLSPGLGIKSRNFNGLLHVLPVSRYGEYAVIGKAFVIKSIDPVSRVKGKLLRNGEFSLSWKWPKNAEKVTVLYSFKGHNDPSPNWKECMKSYNERFKLEQVDLNQTLFVTILVTEEFNGEAYHSSPVTYRFPEKEPVQIHYKVDVKRKTLLPWKKKALLKIKAPEMDIPNLLVLKRENGVLYGKSEGTLIKKIKAAKGKKEHVIDLTNYIENMTFVSLICEEETESQDFSLVLEPKGSAVLF